MKRFVVIFLGGYFFVGILYSIGFGYYFHLVLQRAGINSHSDLIQKIQSADVAEEGLQLCLVGTMVGSESDRFRLTIPLHKLSKGMSFDEESEIIFSDFDKSSVSLSRNYLRSGCDIKLEKYIHSLPIRRVKLKTNYSIGVDENVEREVDKNTLDLVVYEVTQEGTVSDYKISKRILLVSNKPIFGQSKYIFVKSLDEKKRGGPQWYVVVPFAVLLDAAVFPYQVYMWLKYAEAH